MKFPTMARDFVAAASACQQPVKLNMALKLPSGMFPDIPDFSLKYPAIWNFKHQRPPLKVHSLTRNKIRSSQSGNSCQNIDSDVIF